jgi:hypothetical protein
VLVESERAYPLVHCGGGKHALKLDVQVGKDHLVRLPDEVPMGPAEIIVLLEESVIQGTLEDFEPVQPACPVRLSSLVLEGRD